jgi:DNA-binding transcriptional MerR regulator
MNDALIGISVAARTLGVAEGTVRRFSDGRVVRAARDTAGRRLLTQKQVEELREHFASRRGRTA